MNRKRTLRALLAVSLCALASAAGAAASGGELRGIDPNQGESLVEFTLPSRAAAMRLQLGAGAYGVEFNDHYLRRNADGSVVVTVFGTEAELAKLEAAGYERGATIESVATWKQRLAERAAVIRAEDRSRALALRPGRFFTHDNEVVILRADYFENYAGRFLSVEAKSRAGDRFGNPTLTLSYDDGVGTALANARTMAPNIDPDTTPDTYVEHRELVRIGGVSSSTPAAPSLVRVASSNGGVAEAPVSIWLGGGLPPHAAGYLSDFTTRYLDPTEVYARFGELAAEFPNVSRLIQLPYKTNGYQRRAQATMSGLTLPGNTPAGSQQAAAVVLTSRAWGHEGGNEITAAFRNPATPNSPLSVVVSGKDIVVNLATSSTGATTSWCAARHARSRRSTAS